MLNGMFGNVVLKSIHVVFDIKLYAYTMKKKYRCITRTPVDSMNFLYLNFTKDSLKTIKHRIS